MSRQFVQVRYRPGDTKTYMYHNDGAAVAAGETIRVPQRDGWMKVEVVSIGHAEPTFPTKAILGPYNPDEVYDRD